MQTIDDILTRIQRVKALCESPNVNEAAAAAAKLQNLLLKYNLSMADVERHERADTYSREEIALHARGWRVYLMFGIARANLCRAIQHGNSNRLTILGEPHNVLVVKYLFDYLESELQRLAASGFDDAVAKQIAWLHEQGRTQITAKDLDLTQHKRRWKGNFLLGGAIEVGRILQGEQQQQRREHAEVNALVLDKEASLRAYVKEQFPHTVKKQASISDSYAYDSGRSAARNINLSKQMNAGSRAALGPGR